MIWGRFVREVVPENLDADLKGGWNKWGSWIELSVMVIIGMKLSFFSLESFFVIPYDAAV
jgi:hypothetical protein